MQLRQISYLMIWTLVPLLCSCEQELELPLPSEPKIVLLGELVAEDSIFIRGGQGIPLKGSGLQQRTLVQQLSLTVQEEAGSSWQLSSTEDETSASEYMLAFSAGQRLQAGRSYTVRASQPSMGEATATVLLPQPFSTLLADTAAVVFNGQDSRQFDLRIDDLAGKHFYVLEVTQQPFSLEGVFLFNGSWLKMSEYVARYDSLLNAGVLVPQKTDTFYQRSYNRIPVYTKDSRSEHWINGKGAELARRVLLTDEGFSGTSHLTSLVIPRHLLNEQIQGTGLRTLIQVKSVTEAYFRYLQAYEQYDPFSGTFNSAVPLQLPGNISNGVGIIGGVYRKEFVFYFQQ